jgi:hypothetical protein
MGGALLLQHHEELWCPKDPNPGRHLVSIGSYEAEYGFLSLELPGS